MSDIAILGEEFIELSMDFSRLQSVVESILFTLGTAVEVKRLAEAAGVKEKEILAAADALEEKYRSPGSGVMLLRLENSLQLCTKTENYEYLVRIASAPRTYKMSDTVLETLSIIAYKQPVTRQQIEHIRGVNSSYAIDRLLEYDLIRELGRLNAPGHPLLFGTTEEFLRCFGVQSLSELPKLNPDKEADFLMQAEAEVPIGEEELPGDEEREDTAAGEGTPEDPVPVGI